MNQSKYQTAMHQAGLVTVPEGVVKPVVEMSPKLQLRCPACEGYHFTVDVNVHTGTYHWQCEVCDTPWEISCTPDQGYVMKADDPDVHAHNHGYALLSYRGGGFPQYIVVATTAPADPTKVDSQLTYRYDEHTCPTNYMRVQHVVVNGNHDPHGLYEFVRFVSNADICKEAGFTPKELSEEGFSDWVAIFPELLRTTLTEEPSRYGV